jgi:anti-sigma B factor antagonist
MDRCPHCGEVLPANRDALCLHCRQRLDQPPSRLDAERLGEVTVVSFRDKKILDEQNIQVIGEQLFSLVDDLGRRKILLNFGNVEYLSSAALGKFITLNKKVAQVGGELILCNIAPEIHEVFEITKLNKVFRIERGRFEGGPDVELGGVASRLKPPKPSGGSSVALRPPPPEFE